MKNETLFGAAENASLLQRIAKLDARTPAHWGRMDSAQMCAHCQMGLRLALGDVKMKQGWIGKLFGRMARKQLFSPQDFKRNLPTDSTFKFRDRRDFARERDGLVQLVQRFGATAPNQLTTSPHPFFGHLEPNEWDVLMWKHLDHHLRQFGV